MNFRNIQIIENEQQRQVSQRYQGKRTKYEISIKTLTKLNSPDLQPKIDKYQRKLDRVKKMEDQKRSNGLPDTEEKNLERKEVERKEQELKKQIGICNSFSFFDLEKGQMLTKCLDYLSDFNDDLKNGTNDKETRQTKLDKKHERLIRKIFQENIKPSIEGPNFDIKFDEKFESKVIKTSLINALLSSHQPEVGEFLHLPEIDPKLAREFSKNIVAGCIKKIVEKVIENVNVELIKKILENFGKEASADKKEQLQAMQKLVTDYILGLKGRKKKEQTDQEWENLCQEAQSKIDYAKTKSEQEVELSLLWHIAYAIPLGIPKWLHNINKKKKINQAATEIVDQNFDMYISSLDAVYSALTTLKKIETIITQEDISAPYYSSPLSFKSFEDLKQSIEKRTKRRVKLTQGEELIDYTQADWILVQRFSKHFIRFKPNVDDTFSAACDKAFEAALDICDQKMWAILSPNEVQDDLARLAVYIGVPLVHYAISEHKPWVAELIEHRIDIHSVDVQGNTALHIAAGEGAVHLIPLLSTHIDLHKENDQKQTPLEFAIQFGKDKVVDALIKKGVNIQRPIYIGQDNSISLTGIGFAVMRGEVKCIEKLIRDKYCSLQDQHGDIGNLLHVAIHFHQFRSLGYLLKEHRIKVFNLIDQKSPSGLTPLNLAASQGEQEPIHLLHKANASLECEDHHQQRPMHHAAKGFHYDTIQLLAALGCKIDPENDEHKRPVDLINPACGTRAISCQGLLNELKANKSLAHRFPVPHFEPPRYG